MIDTFYIEKDLADRPQTQSLLASIPHQRTQIIDDYSKYFGRVKKPYLQKRESLNGFIAQKKGQMVKEAPDAYGLSGEPHYYFIHAFNCLYECHYCYLQGHFHSPDLVFFLNHEQIIQDMKSLTDQFVEQNSPEKSIWFHAGEFSDSLALSHATGELPLYYDFFKSHPRAKLELRTKSTNIKALKELPPLKNVYTTFSLSPQRRSLQTDQKTPPTLHRLKAMQKLHSQGHQLGVHLDPVIYEKDFEAQYRQLLEQIESHVPLREIHYISAGVVRFTKDVYRQVQQNYPNSDIHAAELTTSFDGKVRYPRPMRLWMLSKIEDLLYQYQIPKDRIYLCMED